MKLSRDILKGMPSRKGKAAQEKKKEPHVNSDPLIDEALSGSEQQTAVEAAEDAHGRQEPMHSTPETTTTESTQETASAAPQPVAPALPGGDGSHWKGGEDDDFGLRVETPPRSVTHPRKRQFIAGGAILAVMVVAAVGYLGVDQERVQHLVQAREFTVPKQTNRQAHKSVPHPARSAAVTATPAAQSLNPALIDKEMGSNSRPNTYTQPPAARLPRASADAGQGKPPSPGSGESAYLRWAEAQVNKANAATREPTIPTSALSDQPPSGPGLGGSSNDSEPASGTYQGSQGLYTPAPRYHRPPIPLTISGSNRDTTSDRPAWAHLPQPQSPATLAARAYVIHPAMQAPFRVLRITERGGVPYAFVTQGPVDTGKWVQFDHHYGNGWIVGKISARNERVQFTSPQGFVVSERVQ